MGYDVIVGYVVLVLWGGENFMGWRFLILDGWELFVYCFCIYGRGICLYLFLFMLGNDFGLNFLLRGDVLLGVGVYVVCVVNCWYGYE